MDSKVCRSCMKEAAAWEFANYDKGIMFMFSSCTNIQITENDSLPKQFCYNCTIQIESSYKFIQTAQRTNRTLIELNKAIEPEMVIKDIETECLGNTEETPTESVEDTSDNIEPDDSNVGDSKVTSILQESVELSKKTKGKTPQFSCTVCKKTFLSRVWFQKHTRNYHTKEKYSCSECPKTFLTQSRLSAHAVAHSQERRFVCHCGRRYKRRKELTIHMRTHADARPFVCAHCNMGFKLKSVLKSHLVLHQPDKPYLCSVCGWRFSQAGNLSAHMRAHTGLRPHACACGYRAAAAAGLRRHQRRRGAHTHACRACRRGFHDKAALTRHERSHTGARPYQCPACPRSFSDSWKRKCHLMRAHRMPLAGIPRMRADTHARDAR